MSLLPVLALSIVIVNGGLKNGLYDYYPAKYNLIDTTPLCIERGLCPHIKYGDLNSIHPNNKERMEYFFRNFARLYPKDYLKSAYALGLTYYACAAEQQDFPFYWLSEANQVTRAHSYWGKTCKCKENNTCHSNAHRTCDDYCYLMEPYLTPKEDPCEFGSRNAAFIDQIYYTFTQTQQKLGVWTGAEGIWDMNGGYASSGHCSLVFETGAFHYGIGYWPGGGLMPMISVRHTAGFGEDYPMPHGAHFDETWRVVKDRYDANGNHLHFVTQFFGGLQDPNVTSKKVYLLYDGDAHEMERIVGTDANGFYKLNYDVEGLEKCKPYAFLALDNNGDYWRLPEDDNYYFGTYNDPRLEMPGKCDENHYYRANGVWKANAGPKVAGKPSGCVGCAEMAALETVWKGFLGPTLDPSKAPSFAPSVDVYNYILVTDRALNWEKANQECYDRYGSELATIVDDESARILLYMSGKNDVWIGLNDVKEEKNWVHADGSDCGDIACIDLPYWKKGEPDNFHNGQDGATISGWNEAGDDFNTDIYNMLSDTKPEMERNLICNAERSKYPTPVTHAPTTKRPTAPTVAISTDFILVEEKMNWKDAYIYCYQHYGSELASIGFDDKVAEKLLELAGKEAVWIGLNDERKEGIWVNADGSLCGESNCADLAYWQQYQPDNRFADQHSAFIDGATAHGEGGISNMLVDAKGWYQKYFFICNAKRRPVPTPVPQPTTVKQDYIVVEERLTWSQANDACKSKYDTTLANIYDSDELMQKLLDAVGDKGAWVGLNDITKEADWVNKDGTGCGDTACIKLPYWIEGQPDNWFGWHDVAYIDGRIGHLGDPVRGDIYNMMADYPDSDRHYQDFYVCNGNGRSEFTETKAEQKKRNTTVAVVVAVSLFVLLLIVIGGLIWFMKKKKGAMKAVQIAEEEVEEEDDEANETEMQRVTDTFVN